MKLPFRTALLWSALSGFLALAWEIVWARVFNYASGSRAPVFGYMLGSYLLGLAIGSLWSRRWQRDHSTVDFGSQRLALAGLITRANYAAFMVAPLTAVIACHAPWQWGYLLVAISGALLGIVFPLLCHRSVQTGADSGSRLSWLYLANIIGSGAGSLLTGFILMEWLGLYPLSLLLLAIGAAWACAVAGALSRGLLAAPLFVVLITVSPFQSLYERLQYKTEFNGTMRFAEVVESRHGVITVDTHKCVYGNGAYDGVIETQLEPGSWLVRPYFISAVRDQIENVLVIGVASGGWTQIIANHPQVKHVTAIELSHGYLDLISKQPEVKSLLTNPKVEIVIDDGRRWLRRNPDKKFDAIVMNTTHHWREFASALLSKEFLTQVKSHLTPEGIAFWNCTDSLRAAKTGTEVFPHSIMVINHLLASNAPLTPDRERWARVLSQYRIDDQPVFTDPAKLNAVLDFVNHEGLPREGDKWKWTRHEHVLDLVRDAEPITDDNLGHEY